MKEAIIKIPEGINGLDAQTNGVHPIVILNALQMLSQHFAQEIIKLAKDEVGSNPKRRHEFR